MPRARVLASLLVILAVPVARADGPAPLRFDPKVDVAAAGGTWAAYALTELFKDDLAPGRCRVCDTNALDAKARDALVWPWPEKARTLSDVVAMGVVPAGVGLHQLLAARGAGDAREGWVDLVVIAEAAGIAMDLNQAVKFAVGRQRPAIRYGDYADPARRGEADDNLSFYSGHATFAFSLAAAAGTVSSMRGYRSAPWVWGTGMTLATGVAYLRVAGDQHYLTDVLTGAALGTAVGVAVPYLLHRAKGGEAGTRSGSEVSVVPVIGGVVVLF